MTDTLMTFYSSISGLCFVAGCLLLAHAHNRKTYIKRLLKRGFKTEGKVVEIRQNPGSLFSSQPGEGLAPVVEYTGNSGNLVKHYSTTFRTPSRYQIGQQVPLWYSEYKANRESTLEDDEPGDLPRKIFIIGITLLLISLPKVIAGLLNIL